MRQSQQKRQESILDLLTTTRPLSVLEICATLRISASTVRRDLEELDNEGLVIRTHGGAILRQQGLYKPPHGERMRRNDTEKLAIARAAVSLIGSRETVLITGGTTTFQLAAFLGQSDMEVTVITNAVDIAMEIARNRHVRAIVLGGEIGDCYGTSGEWAESMLQRLPMADKAFVGVDGVCLENGVTTYWPRDAEIHHAMAKRAHKTIVLADHSKFGVTRFCHMFPVSDVSLIVSDSGLPQETVRSYGAVGVKVVTVPVVS